jgi:hypothetical protein
MHLLDVWNQSTKYLERCKDQGHSVMNGRAPVDNLPGNKLAVNTICKAMLNIFFA